ncbi:MAG: hypothetical protein GX282_05015 [Campylobacteraceae bacterium]|nr:hypothetical protein [Campylobacteraceae bacterium]
MKNWQINVVIIWAVCLVLNIYAYLNGRVFDEAFTALFWFFLSVLTLVSIYKTIHHPVLSRALIILVAFISGVFTHFLYHGIINSESLYLGLLSSIISLSLTLGVGVLL